MTGAVATAVGCAVAGAASFGLASVIQERTAKGVPQERALHPRLLGRLVREPLWLASMVILALGQALQILALAFGPLVMVQPLGVTSALFGAVFTAVMTRQRVDRMVVTGAVTCAGGLALFLLMAQPTGPADGFDPRDMLPLAALLALLVLAALTLSAVRGGEVRVLALALAVGICYGFTAALLKVVTVQVQLGGITEPFAHWAVYAVFVTGPMGFLLSQSAFQQGQLVSTALAVITTVDPLVAIAVGVGALGEQVTTTPIALAGEVVGAVAIVVGVAILANRGERLRQADEVKVRSATGGTGHG